MSLRVNLGRGNAGVAMLVLEVERPLAQSVAALTEPERLELEREIVADLRIAAGLADARARRVGRMLPAA